ncbi:uroporphyrinogen-III C-methyltransferase [Hymenobacter jejuensis]|uniref:uroporphyrinogen-III C-methyltransferase n=1 Tax=Hymenobacter jejuensis TaxID=2502781 RepID=A0A5B8A115_9BACT|nr:uroporphyrinogen-III C-methyltransferase [Hymenobacter jejuensis]QDA61074.1 uroporphyrinogen-III C-methyltransferase [Hymenobacter jejuensis]
MVIPELYIVGAGPGDPDLLTVKAYKVLQTADVILYDNLANKELLDIAPAACETIYVGKQPYSHCTPQEVIHELIQEKAFARGRVIRLKGGDPFIFGRGFEELLYAREHGIPGYYIPGISSMQAIGFEDVPLTHRGVSEGIWVLTGTKKDGTLSEDLRLAMRSNATVVIYMGIKKVCEIAATYVQEGHGEMPVAVIQQASLPHRKLVVGRAKDLPDLVRDNHITHPALIVVGEVVALGHSIPSFDGSQAASWR